MKQILVTALLVWITLAAAIGAPNEGWGQQARQLLTPRQHDATHFESALNWCARHMARREYAEALFDCDLAIEREPSNARAHSNRGSLHLLIGDNVAALADFARALELSPQDAILYFNRGLALAKLGRPRDAIADYTMAVQLKPDLAIAFHNRGYEYEVLGQRDLALDDYERALRLDPSLRPSRQGIERLSKQL